MSRALRLIEEVDDNTRDTLFSAFSEVSSSSSTGSDGFPRFTIDASLLPRLGNSLPPQEWLSRYLTQRGFPNIRFEIDYSSIKMVQDPLDPRTIESFEVTVKEVM